MENPGELPPYAPHSPRLNYVARPRPREGPAELRPAWGAGDRQPHGAGGDWLRGGASG